MATESGADSSCSTSSLSTSGGRSSSKKERRQVTRATFEKWQREFEKEHQSMSWLRCEVEKTDKNIVSKLFCLVCQKYEDRIQSVKHFLAAWITGSANQKTSNIIDHAKSEQHKQAMSRLRTDQARASIESITSYSTITRCLSVIDEQTKLKLNRKFELCYVMARESIPFMKYPSLHQLEIHHGVELGTAYSTADSAKTFTDYIAESQRQAFIEYFGKHNHFFSFLIDGSVDAGNVEDELVVIQYCKKDDVCEEIRSVTRYFAVCNPTQGDADGLLNCLGVTLGRLGIEDIQDKSNVLGVRELPILIGGTTDGASVNIGQHNGLRAKLIAALPWLFWSWCFSHRLELACKDSFVSPLYESVSDMLLRLYVLYKKSPKKSRELSTIVDDIKVIFDLSVSGDLPIRSSGTRWIDHKRKAMQRVLDRFGVYITHLEKLSEDVTLRSEDRARLKGYLKLWRHSKILIGCAMFIEAVRPAAVLSLSLQELNTDIVLCIEYTLKSLRSLTTLQTQDPLQWPTVKLARERIKTVGNKSEYQGATLKCYNVSTLEFCKQNVLADLKRLITKTKERLMWSDPGLLRSILAFIDTKKWIYKDDGVGGDYTMFEVRESVECIVTKFRDPLEAKEASLSSVQDEVEEIIEYSRKFLPISTSSYREIWYKLHTCHDSNRWPTLLLLSELVFSLPFSNSRVEQIFSSLGSIKTKRRTNLSTTTLHNLLEIFIEGPPLSKFSPDSAVNLWWKECNTSQRVHQKPRKPYRLRKKVATETDDDESSSSEDELTLMQWDKWFKPVNSDDEFGDQMT